MNKQPQWSFNGIYDQQYDMWIYVGAKSFTVTGKHDTFSTTIGMILDKKMSDKHVDVATTPGERV
jgi:hypothetical protein